MTKITECEIIEAVEDQLSWIQDDTNRQWVKVRLKDGGLRLLKFDSEKEACEYVDENVKRQNKTHYQADSWFSKNW